MNIYGLYENNKEEQCVMVGTPLEIMRFLKVTPRGFNKYIKQGNYQNEYKIVFLYTEDQEENITFEERKNVAINIDFSRFKVCMNC